MNGDEVTTAAAQLAEQILDEVSSSVRDWSAVAAWARDLAALAEAAATPPRARER